MPPHLIIAPMLDPMIFNDPVFVQRLARVQAKRTKSTTEGPASGHQLRWSTKGGNARKRYRPTSYP